MILSQTSPASLDPVARTSAYEMAQLLLEHHATTDFLFSWETYRSGWETIKTSLTYGQEILPIRLPQAGWELVERPILNRVLTAAGAPIENSGVQPRVQMKGHLEAVDRRLSLLRLISNRTLRQGRPDLPFAGYWEQANLAVAVVAELIRRAEEDCDRYQFNEIETLDFNNCLNALRVQLPSTHGMYRLPSELLIEEEKQLDRLARELGPAAQGGTG